jgi:hypothetical protein
VAALGNIRPAVLVHSFRLQDRLLSRAQDISTKRSCSSMREVPAHRPVSDLLWNAISVLKTSADSQGSGQPCTTARSEDGAVGASI